MTGNNNVKKQHYISEKLLRLFANSRNQVVEALVARKIVYVTATHNSMCEGFLYEDDHLSHNIIEKYFCRIESMAVPLVQELVGAIAKHENGEVEFGELQARVEQLLPAAIVFYYRSGALLEEFTSIAKKDKIPLLSRKILNERYIRLLADTIKRGYKFAIIKCDDQFLVSDQYMSTAALAIKSQFFNISNRHIGLRDTLILIPISASYYAVYWHTCGSFGLTEGKINKLTDHDLRLFNRVIINNSYVKSAGKLREVIDEALDEYKWAAPTQIYAGGNPKGYVMGAINKKEVFFYDEDREAFEMLHFAQFMQYENLGRNDICPCGSNKKFKRCHLGAFNKFKAVMNTFRNKDKKAQQSAWRIPGIEIIESPIDQWAGYTNENPIEQIALSNQKISRYG